MPGWRSITEKVRLHHTFEPRRRALRYILRPGMGLQAEVRKGCPHLNPPSFRAGHSLARPYNHTNHHYRARIGPEAPVPSALPSPVIPQTIDPRRRLVLYIAPACR